MQFLLGFFLHVVYQTSHLQSIRFPTFLMVHYPCSLNLPSPKPYFSSDSNSDPFRSASVHIHIVFFFFSEFSYIDIVSAPNTINLYQLWKTECSWSCLISCLCMLVVILEHLLTCLTIATVLPFFFPSFPPCTCS